MALTNKLYNALPKLSNIQGIWRFEDNFNDLSDNGYNLTETSGTIPFDTGKIGKAADLEAGDTEYLAIAHASCANLQITGEITILTWVNIESGIGAGSAYAIAGKYDGNNLRAYTLRINENEKIEAVLSANGIATTTATSTDALSTATFYHVGFTLNQATDKIQTYLNGSANGSSASYTSDIYNANTPFSIGAAFSSGSPVQYFDGLIDEVIIWNTCLTSDEVAQVYAITSEAMYKKCMGFGFGNPYIF